MQLPRLDLTAATVLLAWHVDRPEGLVGDEGEGEVASRTVGSGALLGGNGASGGRTGGFEVGTWQEI